MKAFYLWLAFIFFIALVQVTGHYSHPLKTERYLNPPPEYIEFFHFGFPDSMADSFWLRWIQDSDTCQTYLAPVVYNPDSVKEQGGVFDLVTIPRHKVCDNSWSFKMLDTVTKLAPKFDMPYLAGASALAILVEDFAGASIIYERGIREFPERWQLLYRAAFHYQFNLKDLPKAAELLLEAADRGAPIWVRSLASRLYTAAGQYEMGLSVLESYRKTIDPENKEAVEAVDQRIREFQEKKLQLEKGK